MKRFIFIVSALFWMLSSCTPASEYVLLSGTAQGGLYSVKIRAAKSDSELSAIKSGVDSILLRVDHSLSGYNPGSTLSRFNAGESVGRDSLLSGIYSLSRRYWEMTGGAVDVAAGDLFDLWGFGFTKDSLPSSERVAEVLAKCGMKLLPEDFETLRTSGDAHPRLNFNCVAQGYSCDLIAAYLHSRDIHDMLINVGGEIYCEGLNPSGQPWCVGIDRPVDGNNEPGADLQGYFRADRPSCGIVTSGNYRKYYIRDGRKYSHTIDPRSGYPVSHNLLCATVVAPDATVADALATYCMVVGLEEAAAFIEADDSLEACLVYDENGSMKAWTSKGFLLEEL